MGAAQTPQCSTNAWGLTRPLSLHTAEWYNLPLSPSPLYFCHHSLLSNTLLAWGPLCSCTAEKKRPPPHPPPVARHFIKNHTKWICSKALQGPRFGRLYANSRAQGSRRQIHRFPVHQKQPNWGKESVFRAGGEHRGFLAHELKITVIL